MSGILLPSITDSVVYQPTRLWPAEELAPTCMLLSDTALLFLMPSTVKSEWSPR